MFIGGQRSILDLHHLHSLLVFPPFDEIRVIVMIHAISMREIQVLHLDYDF